MSTKSVIAAVLLIGLGIIFGVTLVSSYKGVDLTFAGEDVKLGAQAKKSKAYPALQELNEAFHSISKEITPTVVFITVESKPQGDSKDDNANRFFHFFGPEFNFKNPKPQPEIGAGSGVILTADGYILTNNHVVENASAKGIEVTLADNRVFKKAKLIGTDKYTDLAVIKIDATNLPVPALGNSDEVEVGHMVFALGNPLGLTSTMTQGIVSALGRQIRIVDDGNPYAIENFIQTDAAVNPGNSGGALVNISGEVIGINTAIATTNARYQGYSFAIPINLAKKVAGDLIKSGKVRRGYIGVQISPMDATTAKAVGFEKPQGVFVQEVNRNSAGEEAGVKAGDIILSVDGKEVNSPNQLQTLVAAKYPGESVALKIYRDGKTIDKKVILKARDEEDEIVPAKDTKKEESAGKESTAAKKLKLENLGIVLRNIDSKVKKDYDVENGVFVESVEPYSEAARRALRPNDVVLSVGDQPVSSVSQFDEILKKKKPGDAILMRVKRENKTVSFIAIEIPSK